MKSTIAVILFLFTPVILANDNSEWARTGHRVTGEIAELHLTEKAKRRITDLLDGESLAFVSTFADEIRSDRSYPNMGSWHYVNFPFDSNYDAHPKSDRGDIYQAINNCITALKDENTSRKDKAFNLRMLVHFIGDLHQPLHIGIADDRGGNRFQVQWFDEGTNLHVVWDEKIIESYNMSYTELVSNRDELSETELEAIRSGSIKDWMNESRELCKDIYANTSSGENLRYEYMYRYVNVVRSQLQKGGIRLAAILNDIFG